MLALWDPSDSHHNAAVATLTAAGDLAIGTLTLAELLVSASGRGESSEKLADLDSLGVTEIELAPGSAPELAWLRAQTGLKLPDCCVLHAGLHAYATAIASFDRRLRRAAAELGFLTA